MTDGEQAPIDASANVGSEGISLGHPIRHATRRDDAVMSRYCTKNVALDARDSALHPIAVHLSQQTVGERLRCLRRRPLPSPRKMASHMLDRRTDRQV